MSQIQQVLKILDDLKIAYEVRHHPPAPTIEEVLKYWDNHEAIHCKNLFFRNHKGNRHYLVIFDCRKNLAVRELEQRLKQGKISFASEKRLKKYLGVSPGSVSPFGLIHDSDKHVHLFIDENLKNVNKISFHPNDNTASLILLFEDFVKFLQWTGNAYEFLQLYDN